MMPLLSVAARSDATAAMGRLVTATEVLVLEAGPSIDPALRLLTFINGRIEFPYRGYGPPGWKNREQWITDTASF